MMPWVEKRLSIGGKNAPGWRFDNQVRVKVVAQIIDYGMLALFACELVLIEFSFI
jgi:hypothetical protein